MMAFFSLQSSRMASFRFTPSGTGSSAYPLLFQLSFIVSVFFESLCFDSGSESLACKSTKLRSLCIFLCDIFIHYSHRIRNFAFHLSKETKKFANEIHTHGRLASWNH